MALFILHECSLGYCLFRVKEYEEVEQQGSEFVASVMDYSKVSSVIELKAFTQFKTSKQALENIKHVSSKSLSEDLQEFLELNLKTKKKTVAKEFTLAVADSGLAKEIHETLNIKLQFGDFVNEIFRAIRLHAHKFLNLKEEDLIKASLGLSHAYSRMKCTYDVNREDKPIIQSIALIDQLDKNINSFSMRIKEWFGWHFPELTKFSADNYTYIRLVQTVQTKENLLENQEEIIPQIQEILEDEDKAQQVVDAAAASMGCELNDFDMMNIKYFCEKVIYLIKFRQDLHEYLKEKMKNLAPNTAALVGEIVGARLISHAGSLSNLSKYPASTIQILGAEKALFRALKTKGKTPKYGLLYHSSFIGRAGPKNKGKISRYLANKLGMCAKIDFFSNDRFEDYGVALKNQIEERMAFLTTGVKPSKNVDVMQNIFESIQEKNSSSLLKKKKKAKTPVKEDEDDEESEEEKPKKKKAKIPAKEDDDSEELEKVEKPKKKTKAKKSIDSCENGDLVKPKKKAKAKKSFDSQLNEFKNASDNNDSEEEPVPKKKKKAKK